METQKERKALRNSTSKARTNDSKRDFSLKKIAHHLMKTVTVKKKPMREYCLWPSTINNEEEGLTIEEFSKESIKLIKELKDEKIHSNTFEEQVHGVKIEVEEHKCIEESLQKKLEERNQEREALEVEVVSLRKEVKKGNTVQNYANSSRELEELINNQ